MRDGLEITVREIVEEDFDVVAAHRAQLWPEGSMEEHRAELPGWAADPDACSFVAVRGAELIGFLEGRLRSHADGCATSPVGYLEGWYVGPAHRRQGAGRALLAAFETWARARGCRELASDTWPENRGSVDAHRRLGFEEVDRVVTFRKPLDADIAVPASARPPLDWE